MKKSTALSHLQAHLERCRVHVTGATRGTGFFVAPGLVVTCAHVAGAERGAVVEVVCDGGTYEGVIRAASPAPRGNRSRGELWPYPDLAVVELRDPPAGHPCVWLDAMPLPSGTELTAAGYSDVYETGVAAERSTPLRAGGCQVFQGGPMVELRDGEVNHGLSGGPVLSHRSGGVCAVVKATRRKDSDLGGLGTPVAALRLLDADVYRELIRAHDVFHAADDRWARRSDLVTGGGTVRGGEDEDEGATAVLGPGEVRRLLGALAALPPRDRPGAHTAAFTAAAPEGCRPRPVPPIVDHRDVFTDLAALMEPDPGVLPYELAFVADRVKEATQGGERWRDCGDTARWLRYQVLIIAGRLLLGDEAVQRLESGGQGMDGVAAGQAGAGAGAGAEAAGGAGAGGDRPSVIGRIRHSMRDRRLYHVMVWRFRSARDITPAGPESDAMPLRQAIEHLAGLLPEQVEAMGGVAVPGLIELILPKEALDEGFPQLPLPPPFDWACLGHKQSVVVRPLERHELPSLQAAVERRWEQLDGRTVGEALVCVCGRDDQHRAALGASFELDPTLAALALAGSPRNGPVSDAYRVAVASGVPMMMWHRDSVACERAGGPSCQVPGRRSCPGGAFLAAARTHLDTTARDELPERVRQLRLEAQLPQHEGGHIGDDIVLLWDDPRRRIPRVPLAPAEEGSP
ncbi:trypsin-like peptidase domain-containing protein [Streptomyces sp. NPDC085481]|uniref:VMAP-C domain-containing protein n=1 Tax=Streptomyces sp. NPDC085481 TaxID=3365727 RepID=UPI0037D42899